MSQARLGCSPDAGAPMAKGGADKIQYDGTKTAPRRTRMGKWNERAIGLPFFSVGVLPSGECQAVATACVTGSPDGSQTPLLRLCIGCLAVLL